MNTGDWISAALNIAQIAAIVIGGLWAYWKFVKGRIFHKRAEPTVEASLLSIGSSYAVRARVTLENTGSSDVPLRVTLLILAAYSGALDERGHAQWRDVARAHAFCDDAGKRDHEEVESQETITDEVLIPLGPNDTPEQEVFAYRVTCQVYERRSSGRGGGICWTTKTVVPAGHEGVTPRGGSMSPSPQRKASEKETQNAEGREVSQRPATEEEIIRAEAPSAPARATPRKKRRDWRFWRRKEE
jgi:hypothetical protein